MSPTQARVQRSCWKKTILFLAFVKGRDEVVEADSWVWEKGKERKKGEIPREWATKAGLAAPSSEDPRRSLEKGKNLQGLLQGRLGHPSGTEALGLIEVPCFLEAQWFQSSA